MGLLGSLFGGQKEHAPLDPSDPVALRLKQNEGTLAGFAGRVKDDLEVVPNERGLYVFVGKPPKTFGIVWFHDGRESNLKILMKEKGLSSATVQTLSDELRAAYSRSIAEPRYEYDLGGRKVLVTTSRTLADDVHRIISAVAS